MVLFSVGESKMMRSRTSLRSMEPKSHSPGCLTLLLYGLLWLSSQEPLCCVHTHRNRVSETAVTSDRVSRQTSPIYTLIDITSVVKQDKSHPHSLRFRFLMNIRESVKSELQMEAHFKPAVYVKSWGEAQNKHLYLWRAINTHTVLPFNLQEGFIGSQGTWQ